MKINNNIGTTFGNPAVFAAYLFIISGVGVFFMKGISAGGYILAGLCILISSFVAFTSSGVEIDTELRQIRNYYKFFGLFKSGKWKSMDLYLGITLIPMKRVYTMASRSNRTTSSVQKDYRIFLVNKSKRPAFAIKKCKTRQQAQNSLDEFSIWLKYPVFSPRRHFA